MRTRPCPRSSLLACLTLLPVLAGCASHGHYDEQAQAVELGERPIAMLGSGVFFDGKIQANVTVSRGIGRGTLGSGKPGTRQRNEEDDLKQMDADQAMAYARARGALGSPMPPVTLRLKLTNLTKETITVEIQDFDSDLGNFAVHPDLIALAPDQVSEPDSMVSQMGVSSERLPFKVTLKLGGAKESQTIVVANVLPPGKPGAN
jgi:hypothetical protein